MKICVFTLGCRVNSYESDAIATSLRSLGHEVTCDGLTQAELYVINTCAVTAEAERKSAQCISRIKKLNSSAKILVCGCASRLSPERFQKDGVIYVTGTANKLDIINRLTEEGIGNFEDETEYAETTAEHLRAKAYIKVQDGCNNFCSYCIIPYLRGRSRSRLIEKAVKEIESVKSSEVVLTGINLSAFGKERGESLVDLIRAISHINKRISLGSISVSLITEEFLESLKALKSFCSHFHISMQSGSDKVLADMNRKYTAKDYLDKVRLIERYFDNPSITTDVIVGYPTESEEDFEASCDLVKACKMSDIHIFPYSPRRGTRAYKLGRLDGAVVTDRVKRITEIKRELNSAYIEKILNKPCNMLVEARDGEYVTGYSERYVKLYVKGDYGEGEIISVTPVEYYKDGAIAVKGV